MFFVSKDFLLILGFSFSLFDIIHICMGLEFSVRSSLLNVSGEVLQIHGIFPSFWYKLFSVFL